MVEAGLVQRFGSGGQVPKFIIHHSLFGVQSSQNFIIHHSMFPITLNQNQGLGY
jgi:hypothetical protein